MLDERQLSEAARRAYERGRLRRGALEALPVLPMTALAVVGATTPWLSLLLGALLAAVVVGLSWRGGESGHGVHAGLIAGALVVIVPVLGRQCAMICIGPLCWSSCILACALAGGGAGVVLARSWRTRSSPAQIASSLAIASLAGAMGCLEIGVGGLALAVVTLAVSSGVLSVARR